MRVRLSDDEELTGLSRSATPAEQSDGEPGPETIRPTLTVEPEPLWAAVRQSWRSRGILIGLAHQVIGFRVPKSILGVWWIPITLTFNTVAMGFIFGFVLDVEAPGGVPYMIFVACGGVSWWIFYRGTIFSMRSFHRFRHSILRFSFPLVLIPFAAVAQIAIELGFVTLFLVAMFAVFWAIDGTLYANISVELLLVPVSLLWLVILAVIVGLITGPVYWRARDVRQAYRLLLPFLMYATPIVYPLSQLEAVVGNAALFNPLTPPVELLRDGLLGIGGVPGWSVATAVGITLVLLVAGLWFTNRFGLSLMWIEEDDEVDDEI